MGITNIRYGLEDKIARFRGEMEAKRQEVLQIESGVMQLSSLHQRIAELEKLIGAAELLIKSDNPEWRADKIRPIRPNAHHNPIKMGELGRKALAVLREATEGMTTRDIAREVLRIEGVEDYDRLTLDKVTNSLGNYLKTHKGDLVESDGAYCQKWRVIR